MIIHELLLFDPEIFILISRPHYSGSAKQMLDHFRISESRVIYIDNRMTASTLFRANIIFIPRGISCGAAPPSLLAQIHSKMLRSINNLIVPLQPYRFLPLPTTRAGDRNASFVINLATPVKTGPIILVSRPSTHKRSLGNENEIANFISQKYKAIPLVFFYGNLSHPDTVKLFRGARVLIAPHGAGQVHSLWMRPGTAMLEISPRVGYNKVYETIAMYRQVHLFNYFDFNANRSTSMHVDITEFTQLFKLLMKDRY